MSRTDVMSDAISFFKSVGYDPKREFRIRFENEPPVDGGGPKREFVSLLLREFLSPSAPIRLFEGPQGRYLPMHNMDALMGGLFNIAGQIIAASALQGGPRFSCLANPVYTYLVTSSLDRVLDDINVTDLSDPCLPDTLDVR